MAPFASRTLGRTGLAVCPIGISASYGVSTQAVERAIDGGVNYLYWGSLRRDRFAQAIRNRRHQRDRSVIVLQSYHRWGWGVERSVERGLKALGLDHADVLLLGYWNRMPPAPIMDACRRVRERGLIGFLGVSTHQRTLVPELASSGSFDLFHVRYNAAHPGAEQDIFPHLQAVDGPGIVAFTATSHKQLLNPRRMPPGEAVPTATDCYRFVLSHPSVHVCATGPAREAHVDQALAALERGPMSAEELAWMRRVGAAVSGKKVQASGG